MVVTLSHPILADSDLGEGDQLLLETDGKSRVIITKEAAMEQISTKRLELEIEILERKRDVTSARVEERIKEWSGNYTPQGFDDSLMGWEMAKRKLEIAEFDAGIAEKRLQIFDLTGNA